MSDQVGRRAFLGKAGVGAGIVWAAPVLLSTAAAAQGTLPAPLFVSSAGDHDISGDDLSVTIGAGAGQLDVQPGDLLLAVTAMHVSNAHLHTMITPGGWSLLSESTSTDAGGGNPGVRAALYSHVVAGGDATYTFTMAMTPPIGSGAWTLLIVAYRGALSVDPAAPGTGAAVTGDFSIGIGGIAPASSSVSTVALIASENPDGPWSGGAYAQRVDYAPHASAPEIWAADAALGVTPVPGETFTSASANHPEVGWLVGVSPY